MRFSSFVTCTFFVMLLAAVSGCKTGGAGSSSGWSTSSWNPANWGRPKSATSTLVDVPLTKPSESSSPSLTVSPGKEMTTASTGSPSATYPNTTASYNAGSGYGYPDTSTYPSTSATTASSSSGAPYMAPQSGYYGSPEVATAANSNTFSPTAVYPTTGAPPSGTNPYYNSAASGGYQIAGTSPSADSTTNTDAQYMASLQSNPESSIPTRYANDPNSRFYTGPTTEAQTATSYGPYGSNANANPTPQRVYPGAVDNTYPGNSSPADTSGYPHGGGTPNADSPAGSTNSPAPANNTPNGTGYNSTVNGQPWNAGNYSSAPQQYTAASSYSPAASTYTPGATSYTPGGENYYSESNNTGEAAYVAGGTPPAATGNYYQSNEPSTPSASSYPNNGMNTPATTPTGQSTAPWTPGSCTSYPTTGTTPPTNTSPAPATTTPSYGSQYPPYSSYPSSSPSNTASPSGNTTPSPSGYTPYGTDSSYR